MANWYINSVAYAAVTLWTAGAAHVVGDIVRQRATPTQGNERCFRCTTAGTSLGTEPTWSLTRGSTTTEAGGPVWTEVTGNEAYQSPGAWSAPGSRIDNVTNSGTTTDNVYVSSNHVETLTTAVKPAAGGAVRLICIDESSSGHVPPQAGDVKTGASVSSTGSLNIDGVVAYCYGVAFSIAAAGTGTITLGYSLGSNPRPFYDHCSFVLGTAGSGSFQFSFSYGVADITCDNCTFQFKAVGQSFKLNNVRATIRNPTIITTAIPSNMFTDTGNYSEMLVIGADLSGETSTNNWVSSGNSKFTFVNCKVPALSANKLTFVTAFNGVMDAIRCDSGGNVQHTQRTNVNGTVSTDFTVKRTGGASDGLAGFSFGMVGGGSHVYYEQVESFPIAIYNSLTGSAKTITVEALVAYAPQPTQDLLWMDVHYLGTTGSTKGSLATSGKVSMVGTGSNLPASTSAWDTGVTARGNTAVASSTGSYPTMIKVASNPNRVFVCTASGTTASSEPAGYATAVDGTAVTDGSAAFTACWRVKLSVTITPQVAGVIQAVVKFVPPNGINYVFIDPFITVT